MPEFETELAQMRLEIANARERLLTCVSALADADLELARRGGWAVRDVLRHVIDSEIAYTKVIAHLRGATLDVAGRDRDVTSVAGAVAALGRSRAALLAVLEGVDEAAFYDLRSLGREQYSVLSVLENVASHDHEHLEQIEKVAGQRER